MAGRRNVIASPGLLALSLYVGPAGEYGKSSTELLRVYQLEAQLRPIAEDTCTPPATTRCTQIWNSSIKLCGAAE